MDGLSNFHSWLFNEDLVGETNQKSGESCLVVLAGDCDHDAIAGLLLNKDVNLVCNKTSHSSNQVSIEYSQTKQTENLTVSALKLRSPNVPGRTSINNESPEYPVLILLAVSAMESRYEGPSSRLTKTLRELETYQLINKQKTNLIILASNACSIPFKNVETWKKRMQEKCQGFQNHVQNITGIRAPFVVVETAAEDFELKMTSQGWELPDGTEQPANLLRVVDEQLKLQNADHVLDRVREYCSSIPEGDSKSDKNSSVSTHFSGSGSLKRRLGFAVLSLLTCTSVYYFFGGVPAGCCFVLLKLFYHQLPFFNSGAQKPPKKE